MRFIDSHLHICEYREPDRAVEFAASNNVLLFSLGVDRESSFTTLRAAQRRPELVKPFVGLHPSEVGKGSDLNWFEGALAQAAGAGELGLDPKYSEVSPKSAQMAAFKGQLAASEKAGKPVQLHSRGAERECLDVLSSFRLKTVLLHWFQGEELLGEASKAGYFISFGPSLLYSKRLQRMASACDPKFLLTETDGPVPFEPLGGVSGPSLIPSVVFKVAQLRQMAFQDAAELIYANGLAYLGIGEKG